MWDFELQCGHGEFAVENAECNCLHIIALFTLQCGHGEFAVENGDQAAIYDTQFPQRFNAATANSPWRTTLAETRLGAPRSLQCGHGEFAVENSAPRPAGHCARTASMRPRRIRRGERQAGAGAG